MDLDFGATWEPPTIDLSRVDELQAEHEARKKQEREAERKRKKKPTAEEKAAADAAQQEQQEQDDAQIAEATKEAEAALEVKLADFQKRSSSRKIVSTPNYPPECPPALNPPEHPKNRASPPPPTAL
jgi:hypothetical protein